MHKFNDNRNREWNLAINIDAIKRVRDKVDVDLLDMENGRVFERLIDDPVTLCNVIFVLILPEAEKKSITDEDFGRSMAGDAIEHATTALLEELVDFFPGPRRATLKKALGKLQKVQSLMIEIVDKQLDDPRIEEKMTQLVQSTLGKPFTDLLESSESTPDP